MSQVRSCHDARHRLDQHLRKLFPRVQRTPEQGGSCVQSEREPDNVLHWPFRGSIPMTSAQKCRLTFHQVIGDKLPSYSGSSKYNFNSARGSSPRFALRAARIVRAPAIQSSPNREGGVSTLGVTSGIVPVLNLSSSCWLDIRYLSN